MNSVGKFIRNTLSLGVALMMALPGISFAGSEKLDVAAMLGSPVEQQWVGRIHDALVEAEKRGDINYEVSENVADADMVRVLREYASEGKDLIVGEVYPVEREAREVARAFPEVMFLMGSSGEPQEPNFAIYDNYNQDASYLAGLIAGSLTQSNILGTVGGYPIPEVNRLMHAFKQGACEVNPDITLRVGFISSWYDPPAAKENALAQINAGADVIYAERYGAIRGAEEAGVPAIANLTHYEREYRDTVVTSTLWDASPIIDNAIKHVRETGSLKITDYGHDYGMMEQGGAGLAPLGPWKEKIPTDILDLVNKREQQIRKGEFQAKVVNGNIKSGGC